MKTFRIFMDGLHSRNAYLKVAAIFSKTDITKNIF